MLNVVVALQPYRRHHLKRLLQSYPPDPAYQWDKRKDVDVGRRFIDHIRSGIKERTKFTSVGLEEICRILDIDENSDGRIIHQTIRQFDRGKAFQEWNMLNLKLQALRRKVLDLCQHSSICTDHIPEHAPRKVHKNTGGADITIGENIVANSSNISCKLHHSQTQDKREHYQYNIDQPRIHRKQSSTKWQQQLKHLPTALENLERKTRLAAQKRDQCPLFRKYSRAQSLWKNLNGRHKNGEMYKYRGKAFEERAFTNASRLLIEKLMHRDLALCESELSITYDVPLRIVTNQSWSKVKAPLNVNCSLSDPDVCLWNSVLERDGIDRIDSNVNGEHEYGNQMQWSKCRPNFTGVHTVHHTLHKSTCSNSHACACVNNSSEVKEDGIDRNERLLNSSVKNGCSEGEADIVALDKNGYVVGIVEVKAGCLAIAEAYYQQSRHIQSIRTSLTSEHHQTYGEASSIGASPTFSPTCTRLQRPTTITTNVKNKHTQPLIRLGGRCLHPNGVLVVVVTLLPPNRYALGCPPSTLHLYCQALTKHALWNVDELTNADVSHVVGYVHENLKQDKDPLQWMEEYGEHHLLIL
eukprot:CFRG6348T1